MEKQTKLSVNVPERLKTTLFRYAEGAGTDVTSIVIRALHEFLAEPLILQATATSTNGFRDGVECDRCGETDPVQFVALQDDPLYVVCAPYCADGPYDAHGEQLETGDQVRLYHGYPDQVIGVIVSFSTDSTWTSLANIQVPGVPKLFQQNTRKLQKVER